MKRKIRLALYVRVAFVLLGPGLYLLINIFISADNKSDDDSRVELTDSERLSRHVLSFSEARREGEVNFERLTPRLIPRSIRKAFRVVANVAFSCYCFLMLAILCDEYFIGSIEILCQKLHLNPNRAGATLMAVATSAPELFISCIGTFVTEGDVGVGTIVGSANFNILAVPACVGLFTRTSIQLEWWTVTRDCLFYGLSVLGFITVISDNQVMWYEAAALCGAYGVYLILMHKDDEKVYALTRKVLHRIRLHPDDEVSEISPLFAVKKSQQELSEPSLKLDATCDENCATNPWKVPRNASTLKFFLCWPITIMLWLTVPDARRFKSCYVLTFINCVLWISSLSYFVVFLSTNVDTVMGLTFLAAGTSMPEVVSSVIVTAQGFGSMGFHNSIHSNVFDILLCLGLPWLIKTLIAPTVAGQPWIVLESTGLSYSSISLLTTLAALYFAFLLNSFRLDRKIGIGCLALYLLFLLFALLVEFNIFFPIEPIDH